MSSLVTENTTNTEIEEEMAAISREVSNELREVDVTSRPASAVTVPVQTHIIYVLDRSGSMQPLKKAVEENFEGWCKAQETVVEGEDMLPRLTLAQFSDGNPEITHYDNIKERKLLKYDPCGCTALYDCLGRIFEEYGNEEGAIVVIYTDGEENSSNRWTKEMVTKKIIHLQEEKGWKFEFSAANQDSWAVGNSIGITNTQDFLPTPDGLSRALRVSRNTSLGYRQSSAQRIREPPGARRVRSQPILGSNIEPDEWNQLQNDQYDVHIGPPVDLEPPTLVRRNQTLLPSGAGFNVFSRHQSSGPQ